MINWEIVLSILVAYGIKNVFTILFCSFLKAFFPNRWDQSKKDYLYSKIRFYDALDDYKKRNSQKNSHWRDQ